MAGDLFVTALPETKARYRTVAEGGWAWWNFAITLIPNMRLNFDNHHQYVLYGGTQFEAVPDSDRARRESKTTSFTPFSG